MGFVDDLRVFFFDEEEATADVAAEGAEETAVAGVCSLRGLPASLSASKDASAYSSPLAAAGTGAAGAAAGASALTLDWRLAFVLLPALTDDRFDSMASFGELTAVAGAS
jgi:hypothetical protein